MDWVLLGSFAYADDVKIYPVFYSSVRDNWTTFDINWDNYRSLPALKGWYVSSVHDSRTESPVLKKIAWNADAAPTGTLTLDVRSSDDPNMTSASPWVPVSNGQTTGFPSAKRYLQYRASLSRPYGGPSPVFRDVTLSYQVQVAKVEVSTDGRKTWSQAVGREQWYANIVAPENHSLGWVRVTDVRNSTNTSSFPLDCDTTPPNGNVEINDGDDYAGYPDVNLKISAWDLYSVKQMMISTREDFQGAVWIPFNTSAHATLEPGDGVRTVYIRFRDNTGWESAVFNDTIEMHTNPPVGSVIINGGASYSPKNLVVLTLNATHPLGVQEMMISNQDDFADASWVPYEKQCDWVLPTGMGERYVFVIFRDQLGHASATASDGIIVDTQPPLASLSINGGAKYTVSSTVNITLTVIENVKTTAMQVGEEQLLIGEVQPEPFRASFPFNLSAEDGSKTIYARATDGAGNVGPVNSSTIILDTTPPACTVSSLPQNMSERSFQVQWSGSDITSGLVGYDIQYRDGNGTWTDWKLMSNETSSIFTGKNGHAYSFRARARDAAGNLGDYCDPTMTVVNIVVPAAELPKVSIIQPVKGAVLKGEIQITGKASHPDAAKQILEVSVQLDGGPWVPADGTVSWAITLDTINLTEGSHVIRARSFDGLRYSAPSEINVSVNNIEPIPGPGPGGGTDVMPIIIGMVTIVIIAASIGGFLLMRRKKDQTPPGT